jgi:predicted nucleic acid-binding protein
MNSMSALCFVDTNILVYYRDASEPDRQPRAREWFAALWRHGCGRTGIQVLNEYYLTVTRKLRPGLTEEEAWRDVEDLLAWQPVVVDAAVMRKARTATQRFSLSWWDALIVAAAQGCGCDYLLTEDLQDGQDLDGTLVVNPFHHLPEEILVSG